MGLSQDHQQQEQQQQQEQNCNNIIKLFYTHRLLDARGEKDKKIRTEALVINCHGSLCNQILAVIFGNNLKGTYGTT